MLLSIQRNLFLSGQHNAYLATETVVAGAYKHPNISFAGPGGHRACSTRLLRLLKQGRPGSAAALDTTGNKLH